MTFEELLRYKALDLKYVNHNEGLHNLVDQGAIDVPDIDDMTRNICARISKELFEEVEKVCGLLSFSKRQFVELAIIDALDKAGAVLKEVQPFDREGGLSVEFQERFE